MARRILRDYRNLITSGPENEIWIKTASGGNELDPGDSVDKFYVMVRGPEGPYEGSLFFFTLEPFTQYTPSNDGKSYPVHPPRVLHISPFTTRSHPNLYLGQTRVNGETAGAKVCLSILGTWAGPSWTPMMTFMTIFQTIRSILDNEPLRNEPGYANRKKDPRIDNYTLHVQYVCLAETVKKTILPALNNTFHRNDPARLFRDEIISIWHEHQTRYMEIMTRLHKKYGGTPVAPTPYMSDKRVYTFTPHMASLKAFRTAPSVADILAKGKSYDSLFNEQTYRKQKLNSVSEISTSYSEEKNKMEKNDIINFDIENHKILKTDVHPECVNVEFHAFSGETEQATYMVNKDDLLQIYTLSNASKVRQWTKDTGTHVPSKPQKMNRENVQFIINMVASELVELAQTVADNPDDAISMVQQGASVDVSRDYVKPTDDTEIIAEQADAAVDMWYYLLNTYAKYGINLDKVFQCVHNANSAKLFSDGTYHRRDDGKILKPPGWTEPDIIGEIKRQQIDGPF